MKTSAALKVQIEAYMLGHYPYFRGGLAVISLLLSKHCLWLSSIFSSLYLSH